jgi:hypothetical protein
MRPQPKNPPTFHYFHAGQEKALKELLVSPSVRVLDVRYGGDTTIVLTEQVIDHRVDAFGEVEHLSECAACPWWGYVTLDAWESVRKVYGSAADKPLGDVSVQRHLQQQQKGGRNGV